MGWTITWEEFRTHVNNLIRISEEEGDGWMWQGNQDLPSGAFVMKRVTRQIPEVFFPADQNNREPLEENTMLFEDPHSEEESPRNCRETTWEYHVLYNPSYGNPVLYFNAFTADGRLLPLEVLWKGLSPGSQNTLQQLRWEALSQQEHPILRRPYFQLHPCKTAEFLETLRGYSLNPVVTWLSSIGPAVGLHIPIQYSTLVNPSK